MSKWTPDEEATEQEEKISSLQRDIIADAGAGRHFTCGGCNLHRPMLMDFFQCFYCRIWFCPACAKKHFATSTDEEDENGNE